MPTIQDYKELALSLLGAFEEVTREHMAMAEVLRHEPKLQIAWKEYLPQASDAVEMNFRALRDAIVSETDFRPALEALSKLP